MIRISSSAGVRMGRARLGRAALLVLPGLWVAAVLAVENALPHGAHVGPLLAAAPAIACAGSGRRQCVVIGGACALLALVPPAAAPGGDPASRCGTAMAVVAVVAAAYLIADRRVRLVRELERAREVAAAAQQALLRPLPRRLEGLAVADDYLSASSGAQVGGDLYEVLATPYGVRVVVGDVRGHGLAAIGTVAALLGCFRDAAHDEPELGGVLARLDRSLARHLRERARAERPSAGAAEPCDQVAEEFATVLLAEVRADGDVRVLNCGHPWPYRIGGGGGTAPGVVPLATAEPLPPLGVADLAAERVAVHRSRLAPGQTLFLYTDGAQDARDGAGTFFPLHRELSAAAPAMLRGEAPCPARLVDAVRTALLRHVRGRLTDDVAMLALTREGARSPARRPPPRTSRPGRVASAAD